MTLIEVVVVVALTGILMVATTSVLRSLLRRESSAPPTLLLANATRLVARDLLNASEFRRLPNGFALRGAIALNGELFSLHQNAIVFFEVERFDGEVVLWRRQNGDQSQGFSESRTPIAAGQFVIALDANELSDFTSPVESQDGWTQLPDRVGISFLDTNGQVLSQESVIRVSQPQAFWIPECGDDRGHETDCSPVGGQEAMC